MSERERERVTVTVIDTDTDTHTHRLTNLSKFYNTAMNETSS